MKKLILFIFLFNNFYCLSEPLLAIILMVKNEQENICKTLQPFVDQGIDSYLIFDTGSTDKTVETVQNFFKDKNISNAHVCQEPFVNFSVSRNRSIELAKEKFPSAKFFLIIDAEWYFQNVKGLIDFCKSKTNDLPQAYLIRLNDTKTDFYSCRLMHAKAFAQFKGVVHESLCCPIVNYLPEEIFILYSPTGKGFEQTRNRWIRDEKLLYDEITKCENDPNIKLNENGQYVRDLFYYGQTLECLGKLKESHDGYLKRSKYGGFNLEEDYETFYRLGRVANQLSKIDKNFTWHMAFDYYMKAHEMRPHRAEPLIRIAEHYWPEYPNKPEANIPCGYLFARRAFELEYPKDDHLFVEKEVYDYDKYDIMSKYAGHVGDFENGERATLMAIKARLPHLYNNLMIYREKLKK